MSKEQKLYESILRKTKLGMLEWRRTTYGTTKDLSTVVVKAGSEEVLKFDWKTEYLEVYGETVLLDNVQNNWKDELADAIKVYFAGLNAVRYNNALEKGMDI